LQSIRSFQTIFISKRSLNNVKNYNLAAPGDTVVINPTDTSYEPVLIAQNLDTSNNNIIIYDWSVSQNTDPSSVIQDIIDKAFDFDLVYLGKFLDTCSKYTVSYTIGSGVNPPNIVKGTEPVGLNAALIT
jgi:hypothetical protein